MVRPIKRLGSLILGRISEYDQKAKVDGMNRRNVVLAALAAGGTYRYTPVQVQKLMFLIDRQISKRIGGPFFDFRPYHYGPFDSAVYSVIDGLVEEGLAVIDGSGKFRTFSLTAEGLKAGAEQLAKLDPKVRAFFEETSAFVRAQSFSSLVSAIYKAFPEMKQNSVFQN